MATRYCSFFRCAETYLTRAPTEKAPASDRVAVIGGGIAGTAAAVVLAERGLSVTLIEANKYLGGRAGAWTETIANGHAQEMERGFHAFFRQYYCLRQLLRRIDPSLSMLTPTSRLSHSWPPRRGGIVCQPSQNGTL